MLDASHNAASWIAKWAAVDGERLAVADDHRRLSYADLDHRIARLAGWLDTQGVAAGDRVAILVGNRSAMLETVFAAARLGAIALPVNTRLSPREIQFLLDDARPTALVHEEHFRELAEHACTLAREAPRVRLEVTDESRPAPGCTDYEAALAGHPPLAEVAPASPEDPMILMYTSGTTGHPKGALLPHRKALYNSRNAEIYFGIQPSDRVLVVSPLFHSLGLQILSLPVLYCGAALVVQAHFDPERLLDAVAREKITYLGAVPDGVPARARRPRGRARRHLGPALAALPLHRRRRGPGRAGARLQAPGPAAGAGLRADRELDPHVPRRRGRRAQGRQRRPARPPREAAHRLPRHHRRTRRRLARRGVRHGDASGENVPGEKGEIVVRGPIVMLGYWERPEATAETLRDGWLRTGDLATRDEEGFITLVGRSREMFISGGENVYPAEVEASYSEHPAIREIAVVGIPDPRWGETGRAHVVLEPGADRHRRRASDLGQGAPRALQAPERVRLREGAAEDGVGKGAEAPAGRRRRLRSGRVARRVDPELPERARASFLLGGTPLEPREPGEKPTKACDRVET